MERKTVNEVAFSGTLKGSIATIAVTDRKNVERLSTMLGTQPDDVEIEYMIVRVSVGLLGRTLTKNEEMLLVNEMKKLISLYRNDQLQDCRQNPTVGEK